VLTNPNEAILFAVLLLILVAFSTHGIEGWQERKDEQRQAELTKQRDAASVELQQRQEEAFRKLSPKEHLDKARQLLKVGGVPLVFGAGQASINEGLKNLDAIPMSAPEFTDAKLLRQQYEAAKKKHDEEQARIQAVKARENAAVAAKQRKLDNEALEAIRIAYAKSLENEMLAAGYDMRVKATGPRHTILRIEWPLVSRVWAYQIENNSIWQDNIQAMRTAGFKHLAITNGLDYDNQSWSWTLQK
jgi:hypothetical protein